jgi:hypothetical protein
LNYWPEYGEGYVIIDFKEAREERHSVPFLQSSRDCDVMLLVVHQAPTSATPLLRFQLYYRHPT